MSKIREHVYFYKTPHGDNIPISSGSGNGELYRAVFPSKELLENLLEKHPEAKNNLYIWIEGGKEFKVN